MTHSHLTELKCCLNAVEAGMADLPMIVGWDIEDGVFSCVPRLIGIMLEELAEAEGHGEALMRRYLAEMTMAEMAWRQFTAEHG